MKHQLFEDDLFESQFEYEQSDLSIDFSHIIRGSTKGLPFFINKLGDDLIGLQIGVGHAQCAGFLLQNCPTIKSMDLVDMYSSYDDNIGQYGFMNSKFEFDHNKDYKKNKFTIIQKSQTEMDEEYAVAVYNLIRTGFVDKVILYRMDSEDFLKYVENESYDFIFLDAHLNYDHAYRDLDHWYPKLKDGGLLAIHDYGAPETYAAVKHFREYNKIKDKSYKVFFDGLVWFKNIERGIADVRPNWELDNK